MPADDPREQRKLEKQKDRSRRILAALGYLASGSLLSEAARRAHIGSPLVRKAAMSLGIPIPQPYAGRVSKYEKVWAALRERPEVKEVTVEVADAATIRPRLASILRMRKEFSTTRWSVRLVDENHLKIRRLGQW
jgi:hypothetical protein